METLIMRGKPVADAYRETIMQRVANALGKGRKVTLAIIVVGDDPASHVYKDRLMKLAESMGIYVKELLYPADTKQEDLLRDIARMNHNRYVTGVLPMMPMPKPLDSDTIGAQPLRYRRTADDADAQTAGQRYNRRGSYRQQGCGLSEREKRWRYVPWLWQNVTLYAACLHGNAGTLRH